MPTLCFVITPPSPSATKQRFCKRTLAHSAGNGANVSVSMSVVAWNSAIAGAGLLGSALVDTWDASASAWAVMDLALDGFGVT